MLFLFITEQPCVIALMLESCLKQNILHQNKLEVVCWLRGIEIVLVLVSMSRVGPLFLPKEYTTINFLPSLYLGESVRPGFDSTPAHNVAASHRQQREQEHNGIDRRVKWTGAAADRWKPRQPGIGGWEKRRNRSLILCSMNTSEFLVSSWSQASNRRSKHQTSLVFLVFPFVLLPAQIHQRGL